MEKKAIFDLPMKVRDYEVDSEGIVNNACYLNYLEHTRHEFCLEAGLPFSAMLREGMCPVVRHVSITYLSSLSSGQCFRSQLSLERRGPRFIFKQWIISEDGRTVIDAEVTIVNIINGHPTRGEELAAAFAPYLSQADQE